jgi:hypothetical protein
MGMRETIRDAKLDEHGIDVNEIDLPLSGDSAEALKKLMAIGIFKNRPEFAKFLAAAYVKNKLGAVMSGDKAPPESTIREIIKENRIDRDFSDADKKKLLVPLLIIGFMAVHRYMVKERVAERRLA